MDYADIIVMKNIIKLIMTFFILTASFSSFALTEQSYIDWSKGKIYSVISVRTEYNYNFPHNRLLQTEAAREKAKVNYFRILSDINISQSVPLMDYISENPVRDSALLTLIDEANLESIEYPDLSTVRLSYSINLYGDNSVANIIMAQEGFYTEELHQYEGFHFKSDYSGIIIDARGVLKSFGGHDVTVQPSMFVSVIDDDGHQVFNQYNVDANVIRRQGMVQYSYNINGDLTDRIGSNPYRMVAYGTGDDVGSVLVITTPDAKRILASSATRDSIRNGRVAIIIDR